VPGDALSGAAKTQGVRFILRNGVIVKTTIQFMLVILLLTGCSEQGTNPDKTYNISGYISQNGISASGVTVSLDDKINWTDQTDIDGYFRIEGVTEGDHLLKSSQTLMDGNFVEKSYELAVYDDILLESLRLPNAIELIDPTLITHHSIQIVWTSSDAEDFREYKLYRHSSSGLDENTGTLVHVSTIANDTTFTDAELSAFQTYYYRLYVMNEFGRLGGSNLISATTEQYELIWNGDFEADDNLLTWWDHTEGDVDYSGQDWSGGERSLVMIADSTFSSQWGYYASISKNFISNPLEPGRNYKLSGYVKTSGFVGPTPGPAWVSTGAHIRMHLGDGDDRFQIWLELGGDTDWTLLEQEFTSPSFTTGGWIDLGSTSKYTWFDDVTLQLAD